jgi:rhodanese-related sulfurtransferase
VTSAAISREELREKIERAEPFVLVDARSPMAYARSHLPGAVNLPSIWVDERAGRRIPDRDTEVVVYCQNVECDSSIKVADRLLELGYRRVSHYEGGQVDWVEAGLALDDGAPR